MYNIQLNYANIANVHSKKVQGPSNVKQQANHCRLFPKALSTHTDRTKRHSGATEELMIYLLVFL